MTLYDIDRDEWEEPGRTIAGHTSSPPLEWSKITNVTLHYPGTADAVDPNAATIDAFTAYLRNMQRWYIENRRYSIGYNAAVWGPLSAEIRGDAFRCAANGNTTVNTPSFAVQIRAGRIGPLARAASPAEIEQVRGIVAWVEHRAGRTVDILGHQDHKSTSCPGDAIYEQIQSGIFRPVPPPKESDDMRLVRVRGDSAVYLIDGMFARWVRNGDDLARFADLFNLDPASIDELERADLYPYTLVGEQPQYSTHPTTAPTSVFDFHG